MNTKNNLLEKLNNLPAAEPELAEIEAIREFESEKASGTLELTNLNEVRDRVDRANGRISLRVPKQLHVDLIEAAEDEGVSLNQYISYLLASCVDR